MKNIYIMTIDLGTSFIKVGVYNGVGVCKAITQQEIKNDSSQKGIFVQSGVEIFECVIQCMRECVDILGEESKKVIAIGFTGQMAGFMGVDKEWNDITTWTCSLDTRYVPYAQKQMEQLKDDFFNISATNGPLVAPKCEWFITEFPNEAKKVRKYLLISSYIIGKLGKMNIEDATLDCSFVTWTGLGDVQQGKWSEKLCEAVGISVELLPRIVKSNEVCAYLDREIAEKVGLRSGIPLVSGAGDKISGCIGSGILESGDFIFETSSYAAISCLTNECRLNQVARDYDAIPALKGGQFYAHKYFPGSGITLKWFIENFVGKYAQEENAFTYIEELADKVPSGADGLMAIGLLGGSSMPFDGEIKGQWVGFTWSHKKEHFYKALLESYAYELALTIDSIKEMYPEFKDNYRIKLIGGGAKSKIWPQILADVTGCEFDLLDRDDVALWGAAILAGNGIGIFEDIGEIVKQTVKVQKVIKPNIENRVKYQALKQVYANLKKDTHKVCKELNNSI